MNIKLANRVKKLIDPTVEDSLKLASKPGVISLAGGIPNPELFPIEEINLSLKKLLKNDEKKVLQYSQTAGISELRKIIARYYSNKWKKKISLDEVLITTGSQQALDLLGKAFLEKGDCVITENPTYFVALSAFNGYEVQYKTVQLKENSIDIKQLESHLIEKREKIKFIYSIPTFQNPSGNCWSEDARNKVIRLISKYKCLLIEDDPYSELYFGNESPKNLVVYDHRESIIYLGTFSKTFCPGLRIGYVIGSKELIKKLSLIKQGMDLHSPTFSQYLIYEFIKNEQTFNIHLNKIRQYYKEKCQYMIWCLNKYLKNKATWTNPQGGIFIWLTISGVDCRELYQKAIVYGLAFMPGYPFYANQPQLDTIRLTFATATNEEIKKGIIILRDLLNKKA
ncbi:2-aminoadipate aminotransferase [Candidatus Roizmanbacteria bacterium CG02_land_8_20_14_3_00_36_15]|uniref:2-aminoadipate aminotransferase n=3 Tax=Candidatus Roizmaniibacteriota TaxID=1752723 RepID=A0A2M8EXW4_9BACT|nr:MAG: 2-aminoadipate aminotransferase [Candidatus Roizmanbacteria bacterium CG11_big_fil_rev_8_21_14_0_20_35_14]PIV09082.1 MAG: 2-aminoadipate aminotransferase [Candidatus Roizmanbacteria bacterium CG03_land_8_20_14_0_80_36_21]PIV38190.1 MAG: 2-aminoadipate aminotransferase [Candidatus Roizmanbacteria bacterium CG02_land_8_20_14_3_00_36_15]PIY70230.1 MAG: 2-aminoadipate aminotransferase [Candidatus Roizmanbacteria bacterium CG_4_10_14_0_8_um_filter_36_36]PJA52957.1 MAG: 2-aminoadipate aminotr